MTPHAIRTVLVATDLSEASREVLRAAAAVAAHTGAELHALHVYDFQPNPYLDLPDGAPTFQDRVRGAEAALDEQLAAALPAGAPVASREVVIDVPHRAILARALQLSADLVVLGPHRKGGLEQRFLGSTADRVVRSAEVPCLVVRCHLNLPLRRIVVPVDLSDPAREALDLALDWGWQLGSRGAPTVGPALDVRVVHVLPAELMGTGALTSGNARVGPQLHHDVGAAVERSGHSARRASSCPFPTVPGRAWSSPRPARRPASCRSPRCRSRAPATRCAAARPYAGAGIP